MGILSWIVMGLIVGALAKWIMPGPDPGGCIVTTLIGIAGAFVGAALSALCWALVPSAASTSAAFYLPLLARSCCSLFTGRWLNAAD